jgi:hypothetical protein
MGFMFTSGDSKLVDGWSDDAADVEKNSLAA